MGQETSTPGNEEIVLPDFTLDENITIEKILFYAYSNPQRTKYPSLPEKYFHFMNYQNELYEKNDNLRYWLQKANTEIPLAKKRLEEANIKFGDVSNLNPDVD